MLFTCWSVKGGAGTTVTATALAILLSRTSPAGAVVADLAGDVPSVLGVADPRDPGLSDWVAAGGAVPPDALGRLELDVGGGLRLLPRGTGPLGDARRLAVLGALLRADGRPVVADCGVVQPDSPVAGLVGAGDPSLLVTRGCYLALRRAPLVPCHPTGVVHLQEEGRALAGRDIADVVGAPVVAEVPVEPAVARAVDAGLLPSRLPRGLARALRELCSA
ncbi:MAG: hypothetical protein HYX34_14050 [Actinobacteria bacterium]|nr:hypothetical protein [Actinomycetota bacterium]